MTDVFLSYKRDDEERVFRLVKALEKHGFSVWWDRGLPGGSNWREHIEVALAEAKVVVVAWSRASVGPDGGFVRDEATRALAEQRLIPVLLDRVQPPLGFGELQAVDLTRWKSNANDPFLLDLVALIRAKLERREAPAPTAPRGRLARRIWAGGGVSAMLIAGTTLGVNAFSVQDRICSVGVEVSDACGALGAGRRPTREERLAWAALPTGSCPALRDFVERYPEGAYRGAAADLITARRVTTSEQWVAAEQQLALYVSSGDGAANESAARAAALARGNTLAERRCRDFSASGAFRFIRARLEPEEWICRADGGGMSCAIEGRAICELQQRELVETETCGSSPGAQPGRQQG